MRTLQGDQLIDQLGIDYFKQGSTFGALSEEAIQYMVEQGVIIQLGPGEQLYKYGDPGDCFYIVLQGTVQLKARYKDEVDTVRDFTFGEQMGFVALIALDTQTGTAQAVEDSIILKVPSSLFYDLHKKLPSDFGILMINLSREIARIIRELFTTH